MLCGGSNKLGSLSGEPIEICLLGPHCKSVFWTDLVFSAVISRVYSASPRCKYRSVCVVIKGQTIYEFCIQCSIMVVLCCAILRRPESVVLI